MISLFTKYRDTNEFTYTAGIEVVDQVNCTSEVLCEDWDVIGLQGNSRSCDAATPSPEHLEELQSILFPASFLLR